MEITRFCYRCVGVKSGLLLTTKGMVKCTPLYILSNTQLMFSRILQVIADSHSMTHASVFGIFSNTHAKR